MIRVRRGTLIDGSCAFCHRNIGACGFITRRQKLWVLDGDGLKVCVCDTCMADLRRATHVDPSDAYLQEMYDE